ncbi:hypothetical protein ME121_2022 [Methylobacterium sp. ME121]|nr:hypothetical protein ME121_2022 [Methylobacterium sp. ME121]
MHSCEGLLLAEYRVAIQSRIDAKRGLKPAPQHTERLPMAKADIRVELVTGGVATAGLDLDGLRDDIQAELDKLAGRLDLPSPKPKAVPPPKGAQGIDAVLHWLMHVAVEPDMLKVYYQSFVFTLNEIAEARKRDAQAGEEGRNETFVVRVKVFGKNIALPMAKAAIKAALKDAGIS